MRQPAAETAIAATEARIDSFANFISSPLLV
jgi:hypothetical protein